MAQVLYDYTRADASGGSCVAHAWAKVPVALTPQRRDELKAAIVRELKARNAVLVVHYYVDGDLQDLAQATGGCVSDSLEMARFGRDHTAQTLIVSGVRFMGETAKILSPHKRVLMPDLEATCSLDLGCPPDDFAKFCDAHPDRTVVPGLVVDALVHVPFGAYPHECYGLYEADFDHFAEYAAAIAARLAQS